MPSSSFQAGRQLVRRLRSTADSAAILANLTDRQYIQPRTPIREVLDTNCIGLGVCSAAVERAVLWLELDPLTPIGRLRRTELTQLARCLYRFSRLAPGRCNIA